MNFDNEASWLAKKINAKKKMPKNQSDGCQTSEVSKLSEMKSPDDTEIKVPISAFKVNQSKRFCKYDYLRVHEKFSAANYQLFWYYN